MQNSTPNQMLMMLTRVGEGSKLAVTGDLMQSDLKIGGVNGLEDFITKYKRYGSPEDGPIRYIEMGSQDVQRSEVVSKILDIYNTSVKKGIDAALIPKDTLPKDHLPKDTLPKEPLPKEPLPKEPYSKGLFGENTFIL